MVSNGLDCHLMRRCESTGLWIHKNGASFEMETYFYDTDIEQPVAITDEVMAKILTNPDLIWMQYAILPVFLSAYFRNSG